MNTSSFSNLNDSWSVGEFRSVRRAERIMGHVVLTVKGWTYIIYRFRIASLCGLSLLNKRVFVLMSQIMSKIEERLCQATRHFSFL